jgi:HEAT repeat protein
MVIKASASTEIRALVDALGGSDDVHREAAIARLGIIGARAVDRLTDAYANTTTRSTRLAILRALEVIGDHRSAPLARQALGEGGCGHRGTGGRQ